MFDLAIESNFSAAHRIDGYAGVCKDIHGHNFIVEVTVKVKKLNKIGFGIDFLDLKTEVTYFLKQLDHKNLNEIKYFQKTNPTSENIAIWLFKNLSKKINSKNVKVSKIKIKESSDFSATYYGK
jgi:6-pyruvoyltetrahydropterin/6-carboxytetrahydropterin synthase